MVYQIFFTEKPSAYFELVEAPNFKIDSNFIIFYISYHGVMKANVATYPAHAIAKIILNPDTSKNDLRSKKLNGILHSENKFMKIWKILFKK